MCFNLAAEAKCAVQMGVLQPQECANNQNESVSLANAEKEC